jgi:hypothetical protein
MRYDSIGFASWNICGIASVLNYEISNYQYSNEELIQVEDCTKGKRDPTRHGEGDTETS